MPIWPSLVWTANLVFAVVLGTTVSGPPRQPSPLEETAAAVCIHLGHGGSSTACSSDDRGSRNPTTSARTPHSIEAMGRIMEPSTFEYTSRSGAARLRVIYPMGECRKAAVGRGKPFAGSVLAPDNPWFVLAYPRCGPPGANCGGVTPGNMLATHTLGLVPPGTYVYTTPPYLLSGPATMKPPNPDNPSANPHHPNILRHWGNMSQDNPVRVIIACNVASGSAGTDIFTVNPLPGGATYTWASFVSHIQNTFAAFTSCNTADVWVNTTAAFTDTSPWGYSASAAYAAYDPPLPSPPFTRRSMPAPLSVGGAGQLIWDYSAPPTPMPPILPSEPNNNGPTGNGFNEVLFLQRRDLLNGGFCSMDLDPATGEIIECDVAFDVASYAAGAPNPGLPNETTAFRHEIGHFFGLDHTNLQPGSSNYGPPTSSWMGFSSPLNPIELAGMLGVVRRFPGVNMANPIAHPLHSDDAAGLSRIYPVQVPNPNPNPLLRKDPLINTTATIRGAVLKDGTPLFGSNVFVLARPWGTSGQSGPPELDYPRVGTISGTARLTPSDVVGAANIARGRTTSGGFEIIGIPATPSPGQSAYGVMYDVVAEDHGYSLNNALSPSYGEWYKNQFLNPSINTIGLSPKQTRFYANDYRFTNWQPTSWTPLPIVSSFSVLPGTVIDLGGIEHCAFPGGQVADTTSRPLLFISPRTRPAANGTVTLTSASNYPLSTSGLSLTVNGIPFTNWAAATIPPTTGPIVTAIIPANLLLTSGASARLVFTARETVPPGVAGVSFATGRNEVQY